MRRAAPDPWPEMQPHPRPCPSRKRTRSLSSQSSNSAACVFGHRADRAAAARGAGKSDLMSAHDAVVGVRGADFAVEKGEIFCVMGLSGSGKSTLIRLINRLIEPTAGQS